MLAVMGERGFFWMRRLLHLSNRDQGGVFAQKYSFQLTNGPFKAAIMPLMREHQEYIVRNYCNWPLK